MRTTWTFSSAGQIIVGSGAVEQLPDVLRRLGLKRVLLVTDAVLDKVGLVDQVRTPLGNDFTVETFTGGEPEPSLRAAANCVKHARQFQPDGLIGLGGGSNLDLAKMAAAVLAHGSSPRDYLGEDRVPGPILPLVAIPTTAGTGSEVSAAGVFTDEENHIKAGAMSNYMRPAVALVDPKLTLTCPRKVTADSGIDALTHAIEAYTAVDNADFPLPPGQTSIYQGRHPLGDCLAEKAIEIIGANLRRAVEHPDDLAAREAMALGAMLAGLAFSNVGVALVHALEYPVGAATHCSHGEGNGLLLPHVMRYNLKAREKEFARVATLLGVDTDGLSQARAAECAVGAVEELNRAIGIPARLRDLGVQQDQIPGFAEKALGISRIVRVNPRVPTVSEMIELLEQAY
jgi:alcohol dehydrogenase class IV